MIDPVASWVEGLAERVGCHGLGSWLADLGRWLGAAPPFPPVRSARFSVTRGNGIEVELHDKAWQTRTSLPADDWVLYAVLFDASLDFLPFGLSSTDTPADASRKLSQDIVEGREQPDGTRTISYFRPDHRVAAVTFVPQLAGIRSIRLARLYDLPDWREGPPSINRRP